jgi:hypothetical protein
MGALLAGWEQTTNDDDEGALHLVWAYISFARAGPLEQIV